MILPVVAAVAATAAITLPGGTSITDTRVGTGAVAEAGRRVAVHYTGWLYNDGLRGKKFDSSQGGDPIVFTLGAGEVIPGWDAGIAGMKVGGRRILIIPPAQAYGERGAGADIPPGATLTFEVELVATE